MVAVFLPAPPAAGDGHGQICFVARGIGSRYLVRSSVQLQHQLQLVQ